MFLITTSRVLLSSVVGLNYDLGIDVTVALGFDIGRDHVLPVYFMFRVVFAVLCLILTVINKELQLLHKKKFG